MITLHFSKNIFKTFLIIQTQLQYKKVSIESLFKKTRLHIYCQGFDQVQIFSYFLGMKLFGRFRKIIMRFIFPVHARSRSSAAASGAEVAAVPRRSSCDSMTSCSNLYNHYSSDSHYNEAIADCIEFFNKSSYDMVQ